MLSCLFLFWLSCNCLSVSLVICVLSWWVMWWWVRCLVCSLLCLVCSVFSLFLVFWYVVFVCCYCKCSGFRVLVGLLLVSWCSFGVVVVRVVLVFCSLFLVVLIFCLFCVRLRCYWCWFCVCWWWCWILVSCVLIMVIFCDLVV